MSWPRKCRLIFSTGLILCAVRVALRLVSLKQLLPWLACKGAPRCSDKDAIEDVAYYLDRWLSLFPYRPKGNCFPRALALFFYACRAGLPVQFNCGVMKFDHRLEGHAWLMLQNREFLEPSSSWKAFTVTLTFPPSPSVPTD
ncbi:MAG: lasso peptide biosynthesis B2 protein [Nitrospira sp. CR1.2]|nr:lasso peptide biosynthesis B2 protein [Nitrospira sp. CR1.2]